MPDSDAADLRADPSRLLRAPTDAARVAESAPSRAWGPNNQPVPSPDELHAEDSSVLPERSTAARHESASEVIAVPSAPSPLPEHRFAIGAGAFSSQATGENDALQILLQASAAAESLQHRFSELQQRRAELLSEQQQLEADRRTFEQRAQQFAAQVASDRASQRELHAELEHRLAGTAEKEELLERQAAELRAAQRTFNDERVILKQALKSELEEERNRLTLLQKELESEREQLTLRRERDREEHSQRLLEVDNDLRQERQRLTDRLREELASELSQLNREKQEWRITRDQQKAELQQQAEELQQQREVFGEQLEAEQTRLRDELEKRRQMLLTEQSNLQRRYRFQFEHLGRAREDLDTEIRELRREQQMFRTERQRFLEQHRLRFQQLEKIRNHLDAKAHSLSRETRIVERTRAAAMSDIRRLQLRSDEEREAVTRDIENRQRKLRQQEASLTDLAARLEEKGQRLNRLRAELDNTQGEILEQRLTIEESHAAAVRDGTGAEPSRARLEQAQNDVRSFFDRLRAQLNAERDKIDLAASEVTERQAQFRRDRAELEQWFAEREAAVNAAGATSIIQELHATIESQRLQLQELQDRWQSDRREAESGIRELLDQLADREIQAFKEARPAIQQMLPASTGTEPHADSTNANSTKTVSTSPQNPARDAA